MGVVANSRSRLVQAMKRAAAAGESPVSEAWYDDVTLRIGKVKSFVGAVLAATLAVAMWKAFPMPASEATAGWITSVWAELLARFTHQQIFIWGACGFFSFKFPNIYSLNEARCRLPC
jgi:hypothetical protein